MKTKKNYLLLLSTTILLFTMLSCQEETNKSALRYLPADSELIMSFNLNALKNKADISQLKETPIEKEFNDFVSKAGAELFETITQLGENSNATGIDLKSDAFISLTYGENQEFLITFAALIDNPSVLNSTMEKLRKESAVEITGTEDEITYFFISEELQGAYNSDCILLLAGKKGLVNNPRSYLNFLITNPESSSLAANSKIAETFRNKDDVKTWLASSILLHVQPDINKDVMGFYANNILSSSFLTNFENGKIVTKIYLEQSEEYKKQFSQDTKPTNKYSKYLPEKSWMVLAGKSTYTDEIIEQQKLIINNQLSATGIDGTIITDLLESAKGEVIFSLSNSGSTIPDVALIIELKDESGFDKIITKTKSFLPEIKEIDSRSYSYSTPLTPDIHLFYMDNAIMIMTKNLFERCNNGNSLKTPSYWSFFTNSGMFFDFQEFKEGDLFKTIFGISGGDSNKVIKELDNISALRIIKINSEESRITLELVDKSENSLKWITGYIRLFFENN